MQKSTENVAKNIVPIENSKNEESEVENVQRMYGDKIEELQKQIDAANEDKSVVQGECVKLKSQCNDLYAQNQQLLEGKAYLNGIITKQKTKCDKLNANISEQQKMINILQRKYSAMSEKCMA